MSILKDIHHKKVMFRLSNLILAAMIPVILLDIMVRNGYRTLYKRICGEVRAIGHTNPLTISTVILSLTIFISHASIAAQIDGGEARDRTLASPQNHTVEMNEYHTKSTAAEKELDSILRMSESDPNFTNYVLNRYHADGSKYIVINKLISDRLIYLLRKKEREIVHKDCGGKYIYHEICGLDINPLTCAQDYSNNQYLYLSKKVRDGYVILYKWQGIDGVVAKYKMSYANKKWIMTGIYCEGLFDYNMK